MEPTLLEGEHIVADARYYSHVSPQRGDVIVFRHNGVTVLKRVVAVGGDIIEGTPSGLILNGYLLPESGVSSDADASFTFNELTVPPDQLFVVGDNQDVSYDSRVKNYGPVYMTDVVGKVLYIFLSPVRGRQGHEPR